MRVYHHINPINLSNQFIKLLSRHGTIIDPPQKDIYCFGIQFAKLRFIHAAKKIHYQLPPLLCRLTSQLCDNIPLKLWHLSWTFQNSFSGVPYWLLISPGSQLSYPILRSANHFLWNWVFLGNEYSISISLPSGIVFANSIDSGVHGANTELPLMSIFLESDTIDYFSGVYSLTKSYKFLMPLITSSFIPGYRYIVNSDMPVIITIPFFCLAQYK